MITSQLKENITQGWLLCVIRSFLQVGLRFRYRSSHPEVFRKKGVSRNFAKFTEKHLCQSLFFDKVASLTAATLLQKRLWRRCFTEHLWATASVSINSLIMSGFPLTSFHLAEASLSAFLRICTIVCAVVQKYTKCLLFIIIHIFSTHFAINLFHLRNLKT